MRELDVTLIEWPEGRSRGGPRLLGTSRDAELVSLVREHLAAERWQEAADLQGTSLGCGDDRLSTDRNRSKMRRVRPNAGKG
jgi:hypothetical protein